MEVSQYGKVAVLMGGISNERDISLESGIAVLDALHRKKITAEKVDPKIDDLEQLKNFDRAFICLHGKDGEDGKIQNFLEQINIPYTGSGIDSSSIGMDKFRCKTIWKTKNVVTPNFLKVKSLSDFEMASDVCKLPFFIKPANSGSSIGIAKVNDKQEFENAFEEARKIDNIVIVESFIQGKEYTLPIIHNKTFPIIEIKSKTDFYDYEAKYIRDDTEFICPTNLSEKLVKNINKECKKAFESIGCKGWGRVDFIIDENEKIFIIEVNTVPGLTNHSLVPMSLKHYGVSFDDLVILILETANA